MSVNHVESPIKQGMMQNAHPTLSVRFIIVRGADMNNSTNKPDNMTKEEWINTPEGRKELLRGKEIVFACCFCDDGIKENEAGKGTATITFDDESCQTYWCHIRCLKKKMTKLCKGEIHE